MIEDERYCVDILTQIKAVKSAIKSVETNIIETHLNHCLTMAVTSKDSKNADKMINEIKGILKSATN